MKIVRTLATCLAISASLSLSSNALAQTVKIGLIGTYSGVMAAYGEQIDRAVKLYTKQHADKLPPGVKVELLIRDEGGPSPEKAKSLAQELIVRDHVQILTGLLWSPNTLAIAPLATEAKVPMVIMNAAASVITTKSPYIVRFSFTEWLHAYTIGRWSAKKYKRASLMVADFVSGHDAEEAFTKGFTEGGGQVISKVRAPLNSLNYAPYLLRIKDEKPDVLFAYVQAGPPATALVKAYADLGLPKAGVKLVGTGTVAADEELENMGDAVLGVVTAFHYSPMADRPANKAFTAAFAKEYGDKAIPTLISVAAWDAMDAIYTAIREQNGRIDPERTMQILSHYKNANSPRGPISIDPETRDIVQNEYIREARRVGGRIINVEFETIPNAKDPWKEFQKK